MKKGFAPIIILVLIVLAFAGYFGYRYLRSTNQTFNLLTAFSPTQSTTPDVTANWKVYTDKNGEFTFKYPSDWGILDLGGPLMIAPSANIENASKMMKNGNFEGGKHTASLFSVLTGVGSMEVNSNEYANTVKTSMQIDNKTADRYESTHIKDTPNGEYTKGDITIDVVIPLGNRRLIEYSLTDQKYSQIFDQILSTFKFIN